MQYAVEILALAAAVQANPVAMPQAVTIAIAPPEPAPPGCEPSYVGSFGIFAQNITTAAAPPEKRQLATQIADGQLQVVKIGQMSQIMDGQMQLGMQDMDMTLNPPEPTPLAPVAPARVVSVLTVTPALEVEGPVPQPSTAEETPAGGPPAVTPVPDAQQQVPSNAPTAVQESIKPSPVVSSSTSSTTGPAGPSVPTAGVNGPEACYQDGALAITLEDGVLKDQQGRTGYIAANYQFQFDGPPQAGAIITAGFSVCNNGSIALGGSTVFYQCLSGSFYNLYDRYWAAQCSPVTISIIFLRKDCPN